MAKSGLKYRVMIGGVMTLTTTDVHLDAGIRRGFGSGAAARELTADVTSGFKLVTAFQQEARS